MYSIIYAVGNILTRKKTQVVLLVGFLPAFVHHSQGYWDKKKYKFDVVL